MKREDPPVPAPPPGQITIHNRLHPGHRYWSGVDEVIRIALRGLPGPWDVSIDPAGRAWFRIEVVAPEGASWSMSVPLHQGPSAEDLAGMVRAACVRPSRLRSGAARTDEAGDPAPSVRPQDAVGDTPK